MKKRPLNHEKRPLLVFFRSQKISQTGGGSSGKFLDFLLDLGVFHLPEPIPRLGGERSSGCHLSLSVPHVPHRSVPHRSVTHRSVTHERYSPALILTHRSDAPERRTGAAHGGRLTGAAHRSRFRKDLSFFLKRF